MSVLAAFMPWLLGAAGLGLTLWLLLRYARGDAVKGDRLDASKKRGRVLTELAKHKVAETRKELDRRRAERRKRRGL